jgi:hypothetical protein
MMQFFKDVIFSRRRHWYKSVIFNLLFAILVILLVNVFYHHTPGGLSVQSRSNLQFANNPDLSSALKQYPNVRPPLYAIALWMFSQLNIPVKLVNQIIFYVTLLWLWIYFRHTIPNVCYFYPVLLYATAHFNYVNMYQYVSEAFTIFLSLLSLSFLLWYLKNSSLVSLLLLAIVTSVNCSMRLFSLFWIVPIVVYNIYLWGHHSGRSKVYHIIIFLSVVLGPLGIWSWKAYTETGYLTGMDRFGPRDLAEGVSHWNNLTNLRTNFVFLFKTIFIDFFSSRRYADHAVIDHDWSISLVESAALIVLCISVAVTMNAIVRAYKKNRANQISGEKIWSRLVLAPSSHSLPFQFLAVYGLMIIILWTIGNNDPIYTRFMYPSYIFLILSGFSIYSWIKQLDSSWFRLPFQVLYISLIVIQLSRMFQFYK